MMTSTMKASHEVHKQLDWKAGLWAGVIAGLVFMMLEMAMVWLFLGGSPWGPPRMIAAMVLGRNVLPPPATFDIGIMMAAMGVHFLLSIIYGLFVGWLVHKLESLGVALLIGAVFGLAIYLINFYLIAPVLFPWFAMARHWVSIFNHILFGIVTAGAYIGLRHKRRVTGPYPR
ncbi:MAG: hypothetical protein M8364_02385 [Methylobacter sp.]|uniref:hypothetical protein n=1 Tax=Methylobacter sp. TaxID=2051955 RepID=UPI0025826C3D|nr:hypothetical protein [Methylobacter sp.]MCL7419739.1 hypothetical protein [Methylobacter sp.]